MFWFIYFNFALKQARKLSGLIKSFPARNELVAANLRDFCGLEVGLGIKFGEEQ
jgi:hypothetical protein